jgi:hypothetical protein
VPAVYGRPEPHPFLRKAKAAVLAGINFRYRSVFRQRDLAVWLAALGREHDALRVLEHAYRNVRFRGKYGVWYAAATACCVASYLRRRGDSRERADPDLQRFIDQPAHALQTQPEVWTAAFVRGHIAGERVRFEKSFDHPSPEVALEAMSWWTATLIFFQEMALAGFPRQGRVGLKRLGAWIDDALGRIRGRLDELTDETDFGPLAFREVRIDPAWLTPSVLSVARRAYDERDFAALPVLADALADAGCGNEDLLRHCRERGLAHCRGCWAVDLILGKE